MKRIEINGDYLIIAPKKECGHHYALSERAFLVDNILNFLSNHLDVTPYEITVYELNEVNHRNYKKEKITTYSKLKILESDKMMKKEDLLRSLKKAEEELDKNFDRPSETKTCNIDDLKLTVTLRPLYASSGRWTVFITNEETNVSETGGMMSYDDAKILFDEFTSDEKKKY